MASRPGRRVWEIRPGLYRSDLDAAMDDAVRAELGIDVLVSLVSSRQWQRRGLDNWSPSPEPEEWIVADVQDDVVDPLPITEWRRAVDAIVSAQRDGRSCLLHCSAGRSRSGIAVVLAIAEIDGVVAADVVEDLTERGLWRGCHPGLLAALARQFGSC